MQTMRRGGTHRSCGRNHFRHPLAVAVVAIGFGGAAMYASAEMRQSLAAPGPGYYLITVAGVAVSLGIVASTFPLLRRITGPEVARNE
jgi:hypothetical protein